MTATAFSTLISQARNIGIVETTAKFWSDSNDLVPILVAGCKDLYRKILDVHGDHFFTNDATNVSLAASTSTLTGVPSDVFRVQLIEPRDLSQSGAGRNIKFTPKDYKHVDFQTARGLDAQDPGLGLEIFYEVTQEGPQVGTVTVNVAPQISSALTLRFVYNPVLSLGSATTATTNPIPGESDWALVAWLIAFARAKEREDRGPDPGWLAVYATEAQSVVQAITPRQEQESAIIEDYFMGWGSI